MSEHRAGWLGIAFAVLLLLQAGMADIPTLDTPIRRIQRFYANHGGIIVVAQVISIFASILFLLFVWALAGQLNPRTAPTITRLRATGVLVGLASIATAIPPVLIALASAPSDAATHAATAGAHVSTFGLIVTALSLSFLTVMVHLELVVRSALILTITSFVPLVSVMSIWPRLARAATTLSEFLVGLLLSKFVVATAVYVGFRLVVTALISPSDNDTTENWMASGVAVLLIAAFSPVVIFTSLRFAHAQAGSVARSLAGTGLSALPTGRLFGNVSRLARPLVRSAQKQLTSRITRLRPKP